MKYSMFLQLFAHAHQERWSSLVDKRAVKHVFKMRWHTPYAQYLWNGDVMYGNPTERRYGPQKISFTSALAHEEWAKYAREVYGEQWKQVYQAALKRRLK